MGCVFQADLLILLGLIHPAVVIWCLSCGWWSKTSLRPCLESWHWLLAEPFFPHHSARLSVFTWHRNVLKDWKWKLQGLSRPLLSSNCRSSFSATSQAFFLHFNNLVFPPIIFSSLIVSSFSGILVQYSKFCCYEFIYTQSLGAAPPLMDWVGDIHTHWEKRGSGMSEIISILNITPVMEVASKF